jgi:sec-independent protein translocase protein TatB
MPGIGFGELAVIFLLLLVFLGPKRLPQAARTFGRVMGEVRRATDELKTALYLEDARQRRSDPTRDPYRRRPTPARRDVEHPPPPDLATAPAADAPAAEAPPDDDKTSGEDSKE